MFTWETAKTPTIDAIGERIRADIDGADERCRIRDDLYVAAADAWLFDQLRPASLGGDPDLVGWFRNGVRAAWWDGSFGWLITQGSTTAPLIAAINPGLARRMFGAVPCPVAASNAGIISLDGSNDSFVGNGTIAFTSGCIGAHWLGALGLVSGAALGPDSLLFGFAPADEWEILPTWNVTGLRGTGSHSIKAEAIEFPETSMVAMLGPAATDEPERAFTFAGLGGLTIGFSVAATQLGIARRALDEADVVLSSRPAQSGGTQVERRTTRRDLMELETRWNQLATGAATAVVRAWDQALTVESIDAEVRAANRATAHIVNRSCVDIVDRVARLVGTAALKPQHPIARCVQDVRPLLGHVSSNENSVVEAAGMWRGEPGPFGRTS